MLDYSLQQAETAGRRLRRGAAPRCATRSSATGVVLDVQGSGPGQKLRIRFARAGVKTVILRFANLELL